MGDIQDNNGDQELTPGDLRAQLEAEKAKTRALTAENSGFKQADQLRDLGFGHLNQRQRTTLLRDLAEENKDLDATNVAAIATDYGWPTEAPKPTPGQGDQNGQQGQQDQNGDEAPFDDGHNDALSAIGLMQRASSVSANTPVGSDFSDEMKKAPSKEALRDLIRTKGPRHGVMHEWDVP